MSFNMGKYKKNKQAAHLKEIIAHLQSLIDHHKLQLGYHSQMIDNYKDRLEDVRCQKTP